MSEKWKIYDELIEGVPAGRTVLDCAVGPHWTYVKTEGSCGVAHTVDQRAGEAMLKGPVIGMDLKDAAALCRSWDFLEATIGMAAVNAWYNRPDHVRAMGAMPETGDRKGNDVFTVLGPQAEGRKVTVVGRFPHLEKTLAPVCELTVLERDPERGDLPDSACEYILQDQDCVIITGMTFTNKTLPRLLELARPDAIVALSGPSVPMSEALAEYGVTHLFGYCVSEEEEAMQTVRTGKHREIFSCGYMLNCKLPKK